MCVCFKLPTVEKTVSVFVYRLIGFQNKTRSKRRKNNTRDKQTYRTFRKKRRAERKERLTLFIVAITWPRSNPWIAIHVKLLRERTSRMMRTIGWQEANSPSPQAQMDKHSLDRRTNRELITQKRDVGKYGAYMSMASGPLLTIL